VKNNFQFSGIHSIQQFIIFLTHFGFTSVLVPYRVLLANGAIGKTWK